MNNSCNLDNKVKFICRCEYKYFFNKANVVGVGLGYKQTRGLSTCTKCITVLVAKKMSQNNLSPQDIIPAQYKGIQTDVIQSGYFRTTGLTGRIRPVHGGYSIGPASKVDGGTMGCLVTDNHDNYILSCNHVLASNYQVPLETPILQPSIFDGGKVSKDAVAILSEFVPIKENTDNYVDCAMGKVLKKNDVSSSIALIGKVKGTVDVKLNEDVKKVGKISELTTGKVKILHVTFRTMILGTIYTFVDQIMTTKMTEPGDSGAVLLNKNNFVAGLTMGETDDLSAHNNIQRVLNSMHVLLVKN